MDIQTIIQAYLVNNEAQKLYVSRLQSRDANISLLGEATQRFIAKDIDLKTFCSQLERILRAGEDWGATGFGFMMELNKLSKYHNETTNNPTTYLRNTLGGLNIATLGSRIEQFHNYLLEDRQRLRQEGKTAHMTVSPKGSSFILSLFAAWLNPKQQPVIYYDSLRKGLYKLIKADLLKTPIGLSLEANTVEIRTKSEHAACVQLIENLTSYIPQDVRVSYWIEYFALWVNDHFQSLIEPSGVLTKETDESNFLSDVPIQAAVIKDAAATYALTSEDGQIGEKLFFKNDPLAPTPEPLITDLIHEVQRHILVEEAVIRRIYHGLLAGHVVLSGPPGTGKTELARLLPEMLWRSAEDGNEEPGDGNVPLTSQSAYTTRMVTATDEWSVRTLISGITPVSKNGSVAYKIQYGHLTSAILKNWSAQGETPEKWSTLTLRRTPVTSSSGVERGTQQTFRGQWLIIDEFNRAPIDLALGEALTALGGNDVLRVMTEDGSMELPIPKDFRVIGTLNSFDRNYLNQISEALKRRFSFIEILPPGRSLREAEQAIVLYKALERVSHLSKEIVAEENGITWNTTGIEANADEGHYSIAWPDEAHAFREAFEAAWCVFETIRIYRQLGTAQAIGLVRHMLIAGILQGYTTREQWIGEALDAALCDTIVDQLQVLLPDEIEALLLALTSERTAFSAAYHHLLVNLADRQQRLYGQLFSLGRINDEQGTAYLSDEEIETSAQSSPPTVAETKLRAIFHLDTPLSRLPQFTRRLRAFKAERGL